jgi:hypothetical protein
MPPATGEFCIGLTHPAFVVAITVGLAGAVGLGVLLVVFEPAAIAASKHRRNVAWFAALVAVVLGPLLLQERLFAWQHPRLVLCTSIVGPYFFAPAVALFVGAFLGHAVLARRRASAQLLAPPKQ